jgi:hypothetical protein
MGQSADATQNRIPGEHYSLEKNTLHFQQILHNSY